MIVVWETGHGYNRAIGNAVVSGLRRSGVECEMIDVGAWDGRAAPSISYGILRGVAPIYQACEEADVDWWNVDKGFFGASHPDGYYRIGYRHLMPLTGQPPWKSPPIIDGMDASLRLDALNLEIKPWRRNADGIVLLCPPTEAMALYYDLDVETWIAEIMEALPPSLRDRVIIRRKGDAPDLADVLPETRLVVVFNSNAAMEALLEGVPAIAQEGLVHSWNRLHPMKDCGRTLDALQIGSRDYLFLYAAATQFTLDEIRSGSPWRYVSGGGDALHTGR